MAEMIEPPIQENKETKTVPTDNTGQMEWLKYITGTILTILAVAFITLLFNYYQQSAVSFEELKNQILEQNIKIDLLLGQKVNSIYTNGQWKNN